MRTHLDTLVVLAALAGAAATPALGQQPSIDPRWLAYIGCWEPVDGAPSLVCVVPAAGRSAVDLVTIEDGEIAARERIAATGERYETGHGDVDCTGWHSAAWSALAQRLYLRSAMACAGGTPRAGTGLIAMTGDGQWLYVQGMTLGRQTGVRVQRYQQASRDVSLPNEIAAALRRDVSTMIQARAAAAVPLSIDDVIEAAQSVDAPVVEAWLVERGEPFTLDADQLVALAESGVAPRVIDLMVALTYPKVFAIDPAARQGERRPASGDRRGAPVHGGGIAPLYGSCAGFSGWYPYASYDCAGYGGYRYGYRWYPWDYPVIIVYTGSGGGGGSSDRPHGRVVKGRGYRQGGNTGSDATPSQPRAPEPRSWGSKGSSSSSGSSSGSKSGSGEQRTAKPRP